jgi:signal peptidase I
MYPQFPRGTNLYVQVPNGNPQFGDVVTYKSTEHVLPQYITHRIVEVRANEPRYLLRGDNNDVADGWVHTNDIVGGVMIVSGEPLTVPLTPRAIRDTVELITK